MKRIWYFSLFIAVSLLVEKSASHAAILTVDINSDRPGINAPNPSATQSGFTGWDIDSSAGTKTTAISGHNITISELGAATFQTRDRQVVADYASSPVGALYRDALQADGGTNGSAGMQLDIDGLVANTQYSLTLWAHEAFGNGTSTDTLAINDLNTSLLLASGTYPGSPQVPSDLSTSRWDVVALTDNAGILKISLIHSWAGGSPEVGALALNGFELSVVPEPNSVVLCVMAGAAGLCHFNRHRRHTQHGKSSR